MLLSLTNKSLKKHSSRLREVKKTNKQAQIKTTSREQCHYTNLGFCLTSVSMYVFVLYLMNCI
jgi:hypothetical protein